MVKLHDAVEILKSAMSPYGAKDLYRPKPGPTDHYRREDVEKMVLSAYAAGWNKAITAIDIPKPIAEAWASPDADANSGAK